MPAQPTSSPRQQWPGTARRLPAFADHSRKVSLRSLALSWFAGRESPQGRHVHHAAVLPQPVDAALDAERLDVAFDALGVVADLLDDPVGPLGIEAEHGAEAIAFADEATYVRVVALECTIDGRRGQAELFGVDHRVD